HGSRPGVAGPSNLVPAKPSWDAAGSAQAAEPTERYLPCHSSFTSVHFLSRNSLMSSTTVLWNTPKELSAAVADHSALLASVGASILPQLRLAFTAFPSLKVTLGLISILI